MAVNILDVMSFVFMTLVIIYFARVLYRDIKTPVKRVVIDDISDRVLSSMAKQLIEAREQRDAIEKQWFDKQLECAELTSEIDRMVEQGAKTDLVKHPIFGGYTRKANED